MTHTPEPWFVSGDGEEIRGEDLQIVVYEMNANIDDARRICACVNACKGLSTEALEAGVLEDLVAALQYVLDFASPEGPEAPEYVSPTIPEWQKLRIHVRAALAKAGKP